MKPFWILITVALVAAALRLRSIRRPTRIILLLLAVVAALFAVDVIHPPSIEELVQQIGSRLGNWTYLLVGVNAFLETGAFLGFIAPGETMVLFGGVLAGEGTIDLATLILVVWLSAMAGDISAYVIGRRAGRDFLIRHGQRIKVGEPQVQFVEGFFARHGRATVLLGRWVGVVRPLVPFLAGSSRMRFAEFLVIDIVATVVWAAGLCVLGSIFWHNFDELVSLVGRALFIIGAVIVLGVALALGASARRDPRRRAHVEAWIEAQRAQRPFVGRPAAACWALMARIEPRLPGASRARPPAQPDTVPAGAGGPGRPEAEEPQPSDPSTR